MKSNTSLSFAVVIPARYKSSRFPGKPLVSLNGLPMIQHVWERCCKAVSSGDVYVATDNEEIQKVCNSFGAQVIMTSENCLTGTDRLAEVNEKLDLDFLINVQGDEPLINPDDILSIIEAYRLNPGQVINAMCNISDTLEFQSLTVPKVVTSISGELLYMSRAPIPLGKSNKFNKAMKQVCIYAFSREHLNFFKSVDRKTPLEEIEDIEILRFLEHDINVKMIMVDEGSVAIDTPEDVSKVLALL